MTKQIKLVVSTRGVTDVMGTLGAELLNADFLIYYLPGYAQLTPAQAYGVSQDVREADLFLIADFSHVALGIDHDKPIINLCWGHPVEEVVGLFKTYNVDYINEKLKRHKIHLWVPCPYAEKEYRDLGFCNSYYYPFGGSEEISFGPTYPYALRWADNTMPNCRVGRIQNASLYVPQLLKALGENSLRRFKLAFLGQAVNNKWLFNLGYDFRADLYALAGETVRLGHQPGIFLPRAEMLKRLGHHELVFPSNKDIQNFMRFNHYQIWYKSMKRTEMVAALKQAYGKDFLLFGDDWKQIGISDSYPSGMDDGPVQNLADISVDFGSLSFETCLYPRTLSILAFNSFLLQYSQPNHKDIFGDLADGIAFSTREGMISKVNHFSKEADQRNRLRQAVKDRILTEYKWLAPVPGMATIVDRIREQACSV